MMKNDLHELIENKKASVSIIGLGYVGLPLAIAIASSGMKVFGVDIAEEKIKQLRQGISPIKGISSNELNVLIQENQFIPSTSFSCISESDIILICVPTPLKKEGNIDLSYINQVLHAIAPYLHKNMLLSLESTIYPGFTKDELKPYLENRGFNVGEEFFLCFSPERVNPGSLNFNIRNTPKIVGGVTSNCLSLATIFYQTFIEQVVPVSSSNTAEMVKLLENTFRFVNIGFVNEMMMICEKLNLDIWEILSAADTKPFGFMKFLPGPGIGGHCIPVDPHYLNWKLNKQHLKSKYIELAEKTKQDVTIFWIDKLISILLDIQPHLPSSRVLILGVAYKKDVSDIRESPALEFIDNLSKYDVNIDYYDPYVPQDTCKVIFSPVDEAYVWVGSIV